MFKKKKFLFAGIVVLLVLGFLGWRGFSSSATYYYEVSEYVGQESMFSNKNVRISGTVMDGTIDRQGSELSFTMTDGLADLPVYFKGVVPDAFKAGDEAVVEGKINPSGTFIATSLIAKCPSKYVPETAVAQN